MRSNLILRCMSVLLKLCFCFCFQMTKKCSQLLILEKQLEEKIIAYSSIAAKNAELEQELMVKFTLFLCFLKLLCLFDL
jgi:hypothetical protein